MIPRRVLNGLVVVPKLKTLLTKISRNKKHNELFYIKHPGMLIQIFHIQLACGCRRRLCSHLSRGFIQK
jgi:hypothetical protein